jgi:hypothetical protein
MSEKRLENAPRLTDESNSKTPEASESSSDKNKLVQAESI